MPDCFIILPPPPDPHDCPPGTHWNGTECVDDGEDDCPPGQVWNGTECVPIDITPENSPGKGNLLYVSTLKGLAACTNAYGTTGADGTPDWKNLSYRRDHRGASIVSQNGVSLFNGGEIDWTTLVSIGDRIVSDDYTIDGNVVGIIDATELTLDNSKFISNKTFTIMHLRDFLQNTPKATAIRAFAFDPFSQNVTKEFFTAGYAMTDDGLYRVEGLPDNPIWTKLLMDDDAAVLIGTALNPPDGRVLSDHKLLYSFAPSTRLPGFIGALATCTISSPAGWSNYYFLYSLNYGVTWNVNTLNYIYSGFGADRYFLYCKGSDHLDNVWYIHGGDAFGDTNAGNYNFNALPFLWRTTTLTPPDFYAVQGFTEPGKWDFYAHLTQVAFPYSDTYGTIYADDARMYAFIIEYDRSGSIRRYDSAMNPVWANSTTGNPVGTRVDDLTWAYNTDANYMATWIHPFDENFMVSHPRAAVSKDIWTTAGGGTLFWQIGALPTNDTRVWSLSPILSEICLIPADVNIFFAVGSNTASAISVGNVFMTLNFGGTYTRIDNVAGPGATSLDAAMFLTAIGDMDYCGVFVDRLFGGLASQGAATMIDVSHYQGTINWATVAVSISSAWIKATQGASYTDPQYATNWSGAGTNGIYRGSYHFYVAGVDPVAQANHFYAIAASAGEIGWAVDVEEINDTTPNNDTPANYKIFLDRMETLTGRKCVIYTRASYWNKYIGFQSWASDYPLWVAHWYAAVPTLPNGWSNWIYWQFSNLGAGVALGMQSDFVDLDKVNG